MRKRFKIPLVGVVAIVVMIVAVAVWAVWSGWVERRAVAFLNSRIPEQIDLQVNVRQFTTDVFSRFAMSDVVVSTRSQGDTVATISSVETSYKWRDLWRGEWAFSHLKIHGLEVVLPRDSAVTFVRSFIPVKDALSQSPARLFRVTVDTFDLGDTRILNRTDRLPILDSIRVAGQASVGSDGVVLRIPAGHAYETVLGSVDFSGTFTSTSGEWHADSVRVVTARSSVLADLSRERWQVHADPIDFEDVKLIVRQLPSARLQFDGEIIPPSAGGWHFDGVVSGQLARYPLDGLDVALGIDGRTLTFERLSGRVAGVQWRGNAILDAGQRPVAYEYDGSVRGFDLSRWVDGGMRTRLSGRIRGRGEGFADPTFKLDLDVALDEGMFDDVVFDGASGRMAVSLDEIILDDGFVVNWDHNQFEGSGRIGYRDSLDLFGNFYATDLRPWRNTLGIDSLGGRSNGYVYMSGRTDDPDLSGRLLCDSVYIGGVDTRNLSASIYVPQFLTTREGSITAQLGYTSVGGIDVDSAIIRATLFRSSIRFDSISATTPSFVIQGRGRFDWSQPSKPLDFFPLDLKWEDQEFSAGDTIALLIDSAGVYLDLLSVNSSFGYFEAAGRYNFNDTVEFILGIEGFPVAPVWQRFMPKSRLDGSFDCTANLSGTLSDPIVELDGQFTSLTYEDLRLGTLKGELSYAAQHVRTERLTLTRRRMEAIFSGVLPLDFSVDPPQFKFLDEPLQGYLSASGEAIPAAYFLPETVEYLRGPFSVSAEVSGTFNRPFFNGTMFLRSGELKAMEIASPITDLSADISLHQDTIRVDRATGLIRDKKRTGEISATGSVRLINYKTFDYGLQVTGRRIPARFEFEDYFVETDLDLEVIGVTPPLVRGTIAPTRVEDRMPFEDDVRSEIIDTNSWDWDFGIKMPANYWIHNDQIDAELSVDMRLLRERGEYTYLGTAEIIRGQVYLFDKTGRIRRGLLSFNNAGEPNPLLDIDVSFRIQQPRADPNSNAGGSLEEPPLELHVSGTANEPIIELLDPDVPYTENDILLLLTANTTFSAAGNSGQDPWADRLRFAATGLLLSEVQRVAARKLGLQTLEIIPGDSNDDTEVTVGRYFSQNLYLYGSSPIDVGGGQEVGFEYRFNRSMYLEGSRNRSNLYRLNIHFSWDY